MHLPELSLDSLAQLLKHEVEQLCTTFTVSRAAVYQVQSSSDIHIYNTDH